MDTKGDVKSNTQDDIKAVRRQITQVYTKGTINMANEEEETTNTLSASENNILFFLRHFAD
jgi:hypothetical protein